MAKVVYLTGAPAAGKSSTARLLSQCVPELLVWEYGARLTDHINAKSARVERQEYLRAKSARIVTPEDVAEVDQELLDFVEENRGKRDILIDSHPVTKEDYGYRLTAFSAEQIVQLGPDEIWLLYVGPEETVRRIADEPAGRPKVSEENARMHTSLQASVAATYGIVVGKPVYLFDTKMPQDEIVKLLVGRLS